MTKLLVLRLKLVEERELWGEAGDDGKEALMPPQAQN